MTNEASRVWNGHDMVSPDKPDDVILHVKVDGRMIYPLHKAETESPKITDDEVSHHPEDKNKKYKIAPWSMYLPKMSQIKINVSGD